MLFQHTWQSVVNGQKKQTRRLIQSGDIPLFDESNPDRPILKVIRTADGGVPKTLYEVGQTHSVQPGIGKKTMGHIRLTAIGRERLQDISDSDILQEIPASSTVANSNDPFTAQQAFTELWAKTHTTPGSRWEDNPEVWVLHFESALKPASSTHRQVK